ncbi:hypothetical protein QR685DRAFT_525037 [Neurospora intermedia]|uniref:Uncharacterized protein n=1 Tax=Neurospora intermedia TaxID=5142 RepID=A0ABR3DE44_NEUIN
MQIWPENKRVSSGILESMIGAQSWRLLLPFFLVLSFLQGSLSQLCYGSRIIRHFSPHSSSTLHTTSPPPQFDI